MCLLRGLERLIYGYKTESKPSKFQDKNIVKNKINFVGFCLKKLRDT